MKNIYKFFMIIIITLSLHIKTHNLRLPDGFPDCRTWQSVLARKVQEFYDVCYDHRLCE